MAWPERAGAVVFDPFRDRVLMQRRKGKWSCFGDDLTTDEQKKIIERPLPAIKRALKKRLNVDVVDLQLIGFGAFETTKKRHSAQYILLHHEDTLQLPVVHAERRWFDYEDALAIDSNSMEVHTRSLLLALGRQVTLESRSRYRTILRKLGLAGEEA